MKLNTARKHDLRTHEGAKAKPINPMQALRRSVCSALLWEREFYEDGTEIAHRVWELSKDISPYDIACLAVRVRTHNKLRHMPLLLVATIIGQKCPQHPSLVADTIANVVRRPDEMAELIAIYANSRGIGPDDIKKALPAQLKKGLARAFTKFDAFQLGKWNREDRAVKLRDVLRLCHPKPTDNAQSELWKSLLDGTLKTPETWEVRLSRGDDKKEAFTELLKTEKIGYMALLMNLRNMCNAGVDTDLIRSVIVARKGAHVVLPFRYTAAARACPQMEPALDQALCEAVLEAPVFDGKTVVLVDCSASMNSPLSAKSDLSRMDAAATLASIFHGDHRVFAFGQNMVEVPPRTGMGGVDAITKAGVDPFGTLLGAAVRHILDNVPHDRLVVITDEQSHDPVPAPRERRSYMINVASARNGVGYHAWRHIDGFSESVLRWMREIEALDDAPEETGEKAAA